MGEILSGEQKDSGNGGVNGRDTMAKRKTVVIVQLRGKILSGEKKDSGNGGVERRDIKWRKE